MFDCRSPNDSNKTWQLDGEVERVLWDQFAPVCFYVSAYCLHLSVSM